MNSLKRLLLSVAAQAERIVNDFENTEAVADSAIQRFAGLVAKVDERAREVTARIDALDRRIGTLSADEHAWAQRALREHGKDKVRALECVRRLHATRLALAQAKQQRDAAGVARREVCERRDELRAQLEAVLQRRCVLAARQHQSEAQQIVADAFGDPEQELTRVLQRWETKISTAEMLQTTLPTGDALASEYAQAEEEQSLHDILLALVEDAKQSGKIQ